MTTPAQSERSFQQQVLQLARVMHWRCYWTWSSLHSPGGFPDLTMLRGDRLVFAELKAERGRVTAEQQTWLDELGAVPGAEGHLWRPSDWALLEQVLR